MQHDCHNRAVYSVCALLVPGHILLFRSSTATVCELINHRFLCECVSVSVLLDLNLKDQELDPDDEHIFGKVSFLQIELQSI